MLPGNPQLLKCPFCGKKKEVMSLRSGNTIGGRRWSDLKSFYPMMPQVSPIQRCPSCGKYFFKNSVKVKQGEGYSSERGELEYDELKEAAIQFGDTLSAEDKTTLNTLLLWAYNDLYNRGTVDDDEQASPEEKSYIGKVLDELLSNKGIDELTRAEYLREKGCFEEAVAVLDSFQTSDERLQKIAELMRRHAKEHSTVAFRIDSKALSGE